jgi:glycosyltransferase involved in cell wall biosynthesis
MNPLPKKLAVLNIGVTRYSRPLSATQHLKFARLSDLAELHVIGLSTRLAFESFAEGARFHLVPLVPGAAFRLCLVFARALLAGIRLGLARRIEVILCESPYEGMAGILLRFLLRLFGRRVAVITEVHGDWESSPFLYRKVPFRSMVEPALRRWTTFVLRRSDLVRAVSRSLKAKAEEAGAPDVAAVFPTFTDFDLFLEPRAIEPGRLPIVLYVGALYPIKGVDVLLSAFSELARTGVEARLVIVGEGPCRTSLQSRHGSGAVRFAGALPQADVRREMLGARLLVLPSLSEGLPRVIMEAMACSLPVVATSVGGIPELVEDGVTGYLVPPGDVEALAKRMRELIEDDPAARRMGSSGREKAERELSSARYFEGYRALFERASELLAQVSAAR